MAQQLSTTYCTFKLFFAKLMTVKLFNAKSWYWFFLPLLCFLAPTRTAFGFFSPNSIQSWSIRPVFPAYTGIWSKRGLLGKSVRLCANACACAGGCELMFEERKSEKVCARERARDKEREWERAFLRVESWNFWRMAIIPAWLSSFFLRLLSAATAAKKWKKRLLRKKIQK